MNCENLMIGDWVMVKHTHREPSAELIEGVGRDVVLIKTDSCMQSFGYDKVSPIPLTPEILEANGWFEMWEGAWEGELALDKRYTKKYYIKNTSIGLVFVHELQHALRLCGLGELADGFKIK